jgi:hypothetical protein
MEIEREEFDLLNAKLDRILQMETTVNALGRILIRRRTAVDRGVSAATIDGNNKISKLEEIGHKRTYVEIGEVAVIPQRKRKSKR